MNTYAIILLLGAFVLGSIPTGVIVARTRGVDLRAVGSGNIGATNVARGLGFRWAIFVLIFDAAKAFVPVMVGKKLMHAGFIQSPEALWIASGAGLSAAVGHVFSVFEKGRGGKGVATALGFALALSPLAALAGIGLYALLFALFRISSVGSLVGVSSFLLFAPLMSPFPRPYFIVSVAVVLLVIIRHRENIVRLARGKEQKTVRRAKRK